MDYNSSNGIPTLNSSINYLTYNTILLYSILIVFRTPKMHLQISWTLKNPLTSDYLVCNKVVHEQLTLSICFSELNQSALWLMKKTMTSRDGKVRPDPGMPYFRLY